MTLPYFLKKSICRLTAEQHASKLISFDAVESLLVMVNSDNETTLERLHWIRKIFPGLKSVFMLQITKEKKLNAQPEHSVFKINKKSFTFFGSPKAELKDFLAQNNFDLLINADGKDLLPLHVVAAAAKASMKIGSTIVSCKALYPISLYSQEPISFEQYIEKCAEYLNALAGKSEANV